MWYVIGEHLPGIIAWWAFQKEEDADKIAKEYNGVALYIKDWNKYAELVNLAAEQCKSVHKMVVTEEWTPVKPSDNANGA